MIFSMFFYWTFFLYSVLEIFPIIRKKPIYSWYYIFSNLASFSTQHVCPCKDAEDYLLKIYCKVCTWRGESSENDKSRLVNRRRGKRLSTLSSSLLPFSFLLPRSIFFFTSFSSGGGRAKKFNIRRCSPHHPRLYISCTYWLCISTYTQTMYIYYIYIFIHVTLHILKSLFGWDFILNLPCQIYFEFDTPRENVLELLDDPLNIFQLRSIDFQKLTSHDEVKFSTPRKSWD